MGPIDWILNVVALLLWLSWRSRRFDPLARTSAASLAGTLRRAEPLTGGWQYLLGLSLLLVLRAVLYWVLGTPIDWTPKLHLGAVVLAFRADRFGSTLLYSLLGFGRALIIAYFWLAVVAILNRAVTEPDPLLRLIRLHLGRVVRWPWPVLALLAPLGMALLWFALHPILTWAGVLEPSHSVSVLTRQSLLLTLALGLSLKFILPVFLLLHFIATYVYLGSSPLWDFVGTTAGRIMAPLGWIPLRFGKLDVRPLISVVLIFLALHWLPAFVESRLAPRGVVLWPH